MQGPATRILLVGLGKAADLHAGANPLLRRHGRAPLPRHGCQEGGGRALRQGLAASRPTTPRRRSPRERCSGTYQYLEYRTKDREKIKVLERLDVLVPDDEDPRGRRGRPSPAGSALGGAVNYVRTIANHPGNHATPSFLAAEAERMAGDSKRRLRCTIFDRQKMEELGMGALLGVAKGSHEPPRFILLEYDCGDPKAPRRSRSSARGSPSTRAASRSSRPRRWRT